MFVDQDPFVPKKSRGIHAGFSKRLPHDDQDVWVERIVFRGGQKAPRTYFKSVFSQVCLKEPPTGATKILYLEDLIEKEPVSNKDDKTGSCVKEKTTTKSRLTLKKREWKSLLGFGLTTYGK